jgi:Squalene-hopene cyclase C-terminal domain
MFFCLATIAERSWQLWSFLTTGKVMAICGGVSFALLAIFLLIASRTRWGHSKPLTKCVVLSILAHIWLLMYAMGSRTILPQGDPDGREQSLLVAFEESSADDSSMSAEDDSEPDLHLDQATPLADLPKPAELESSQEIRWEKPPELLTVVKPTPLPDIPADLLDELQRESISDNSTQLPAPMPPNQLVTAQHSPVSPANTPSLVSISNDYQLRQSADRLQLARAYGADEDTEAAVDAALNWLARAQSEDGGWLAARFGAGTETRALGEFRHNTGEKADTGVTGLALLAFLSAGHTHLDGQYRKTVERGLSYLLQAQMPSGDLSGAKQIGDEKSVVNARMYCHCIAMLALAESHAMTHDMVIREGLIKATNFSLAAQDIRGGGWRYHPGDPGDLSLFGWQAMALKSVARSGIEIPVEVDRRMRRFLDSCAAGNGGLARYRPYEGRPSETMTAEALACRLLLQYPMTADTRREAIGLILSHLPGSQADNVYFWYYATLALFQLQDENWQVWNQALKSRLLQSQEPAYSSEAGSWRPDGIWGGYGGRVYSTAMSCLCLEVYYRYLPIYQRSQTATSPAYFNNR